MENYRFHHDLRVRWSEIDAQGIVFNANYLNYVDMAYQEYLRHELRLVDGIPPTVLATTTIQYRKSAVFDDWLQVWVRTSKIGRTSYTMDFAITRNDEVLLEATSVYVYIDLAASQPIPVPDAWRRAIGAYEPGVVAGIEYPGA